MIDHPDRLLLLRQLDTDHCPLARQDLTKPIPSPVPPPVPARRATTPCSLDAVLCRAWDTKPEQSHQDGVRGNEQVDAAAKRAYADETAWIEQSQCGIGTDAR